MATTMTTATTAHMNAVSLHRLSKSFLCTLISRCANTREYFVVDDFFARLLFLFRHKISDVWCFNKSSKQRANLFFSFRFFLKIVPPAGVSHLPLWSIFSDSFIHQFFSSFTSHSWWTTIFSTSSAVVCVCVPSIASLSLLVPHVYCINVSKISIDPKGKMKKFRMKIWRKKRWKVRRTQCVQCGNRISDFNYVFFFVVSIFLFFLHRFLPNCSLFCL